MAFFDRFKDLGFEKPRRAAALLSLSFFGTIYLLVGLNAPDGWGPAFLALASCYIVAFLALAAEWFWGRWFASGIGWSGVMVGLFSLVMIGWQPALGVYTGLHGIVVLCLMGDRMAALYDLQEGWRQRFGMDEFGVARLRKTVTRAAMSLPTLLVWALAPKDQGAFLAAIAAALLAVAGAGALLRLRTWGLFAVAAASVAVSLLGGATVGASSSEPVGLFTSTGVAPSVAALLLAFSILPFARPAVGYLVARDR